jgi:hypothetical protein
MSALLAALVTLAGPPVALTVEVEDVRVTAGGQAEVRLVMKVRSGFHVQAHPAAEEFLVPLTVELPDRPPVRVGLPVYPPGRPLRLLGATTDLRTYEGVVTVRVPLRAESGAARAGDEVAVLSGSVRHQACDARRCLRPSAVPIQLDVHVRPAPR